MGKEEVLKRIREAERLVRDMLEETEKEREAVLIQARREADRIVEELNSIQGEPKDIGGYYHPDPALAAQAMRPCAALNAIIDGIRSGG